MNKTKKSIVNMITSYMYKIVTMLLGILIPKLFITGYGSEINGLQSSVTQIFSYIALLEAGIGASVIQSMYAPVSSGDTKKINSYLSAASRYYNKTGVIYFAILTSVAIVYSLIIRVDQMPWYMVLSYILITGFMGGANYFYLAKLKLLISATGDAYVDNVMLTVTYVLTSVLKIVLIHFGIHIVILQIGTLAISVFVTLAYFIIAKKKYPWLSFKEKPDFSCTKQKGSVMVHRISSLIFQNVDVLLLTFFCDLTTVSIYTMYKLIINMINTVVATLGDSMNFVFGQKMNTKDPGHVEYKKLIDTFNVFYSALSMGLFTVTYLLILPFMRLYTRGMDADYIIEVLPWLYIAIEILTVGRESMMRTIEVAGHFKTTRWRAVLETVINLVASIIGILVFKHFFGNVGGLYGALIGTVAAMLYRTIDMNIYANRHILKRSSFKSFYVMVTNVAVFVFVALVLKPFMPSINGYLEFFLHAIWITALVVSIFVAVQSALNAKEFKHAVYFVKSRLKRK